jgi:hypothetical protein
MAITAGTAVTAVTACAGDLTITDRWFRARVARLRPVISAPPLPYPIQGLEVGKPPKPAYRTDVKYEGAPSSAVT